MLFTEDIPPLTESKVHINCDRTVVFVAIAEETNSAKLHYAHIEIIATCTYECQTCEVSRSNSCQFLRKYRAQVVAKRYRHDTYASSHKRWVVDIEGLAAPTRDYAFKSCCYER